MTVDQPVLMSVEGNIAILTLNRPKKLNALNYSLIDTFQQHLDAIERDDSVRVIILT